MTEKEKIQNKLKKYGLKGVNIPKRTSKHPLSSHVVLAKEGKQVKLIRFGQQGISGSPRRKGESEQSKDRRASFKARFKKHIDKGPMSAAYWADKVKW